MTREQPPQDCRRPRYWLSRAFVALNVLVTLAAVSWFEETSLTAQSIEATGRYGWLLILGTALCCLVALSDVVVNDLMPARFAMPTALHWRHMGFMGIALQLAAVGVLVVFVKGFTVLVLAYWLNAVFAGALAFFDAFARYPRSPQWRST